MPSLGVCIGTLTFTPILAFQDGRNSLILTPGDSDVHRKEAKTVNGNLFCLVNGPEICRSLRACSVETTGGFIPTAKNRHSF